MNLTKQAGKAHETAAIHGFWRDAPNVATGWELPAEPLTTKLLLITSEVIEAMDELRKSDDTQPHSMRWAAFADELADVIIRTLDIAGYLGIDMEHRVRGKMEANKARSPMHGGKRF